MSKRAEFPLFHFNFSNLIHVHLLAELNLHSELYLQGSLEDGLLLWKMRTGTGRIISSVPHGLKNVYTH